MSKFNIVLCLCVHAQSLSRDWLFVTPWTVAPGSSVHGVSQERILEWVAISFRGSIGPRNHTCVSSIGRWVLSIALRGQPLEVKEWALELSCLNFSPFPGSVVLCKLSSLCLLLLICNMQISVMLPYMAVMKGEPKLLYVEHLEECPIHRKHSAHTGCNF